MSRDFLSPVFFIKQLLLVPVDMPRNDFEFVRIFVEIFEFVIDSPVMNTPGSRLESLRWGNFFKHKSHVPRWLKQPTVNFWNDCPFKDCCMLLKTVKRLPGVQNDSPVMNTPGSHDSPVVNTPGSLDSPVVNTPGSRLLGLFGTSSRRGFQQNFLMFNRPGSQDSPVH